MDERTIQDGAGRDHKLVIHETTATLPITADRFLRISSDGFGKLGLAIGYVKRILKNNPDTCSEWHIAREYSVGGDNGRYFVFID